MKLAVISDLHLGSDNTTDQFGHTESNFLAFLDFLETNFEKIVLLGDVFECLMARTYGDFKKELTKAASLYPKLTARFQTDKYIYIHGNHDPIANHLFNTQEHLTINSAATKILFIHGHQYDNLVQHALWLSELGVYLGGWLIRMGMAPIYKLISTIETSAENSIIKTHEKFKKLSKTNRLISSADIIITGHTHIPIKAEYDNKLYLNSGTCSRGRFTFLSIDTDTNEFKVNKAW